MNKFNSNHNYNIDYTDQVINRTNNFLTIQKYFLSVCLIMLAMILSSCNGGSTSTNSISSARAITTFSLSGSSGVINNNESIAVTVPYGTNITDLVATFTTTGIGVSVSDVKQTSNVTPNDFTNPVTYTVTAADGSTQNYIVTVTIASISAKDITSFLLNNVDGVINGTDISITLPYGTNVSNLIATFATTGQNVKINNTLQISEITSNSFTAPVTYTVTAADGSTKNYIVTVTVSPNPNPPITTKYAYFTNLANNTYTKCTVNSQNGSLANCLSTYVPTISFPMAIAFNDGYAYIANGTGNAYTLCSTNQNNGDLSNCTAITDVALDVNGTKSISFNNNYAYFINSDNSYTRCWALSNGRLSDCVNKTNVNDLALAYGIIFDNVYNAYYVNTASSLYTQCMTNKADGYLLDCISRQIPSQSGALVDSPDGLGFNNGYAYFSSNMNNTYTQCVVNNSTGVLSTCKTVDGSSFLDNPYQVVFNSGYAYFTNLNNNSYTSCIVNPDNGNLSGCTMTMPTGNGALDTPFGLAFN